MKKIHLKKVLLIIIMVILFSLIPKEIAFAQAAPLNPNNVLKITTKNCEDSSRYSRVSNKDRCCLKESIACKDIFSLVPGSNEYQKCNSLLAIDLNSSGSCNYDRKTGPILSGPSVEYGFKYVTPEYCAGRFNVPTSQKKNFFCRVEAENTINIGVDENSTLRVVTQTAAWCFGPGGSSDKVFQSGRYACCPTDDNGTWKFYLYSVNLLPSPLVPWSQCVNGQKYMTSNNISASNFAYNELTPEQVCENDSLIESKNQNASQIKDQCCTCISGSTSCPKTWDAILKDDTLKNNSWTGLGCINRSQTGLATSLMRIFFGIGLVLLLLKLIAIGFDYQSGDPEKIKDARYGILAVIVSFAVGTIGLIALRFIGLDVLGLGASTDIGNLIPTFKP